MACSAIFFFLFAYLLLPFSDKSIGCMTYCRIRFFSVTLMNKTFLSNLSHSACAKIQRGTSCWSKFLYEYGVELRRGEHHSIKFYYLTNYMLLCRRTHDVYDLVEFSCFEFDFIEPDNGKLLQTKSNIIKTPNRIEIYRLRNRTW